MMQFKADNAEPILYSLSCYGIYLNFSAWAQRTLIWRNVEHCRFLCNYSFITSLVWRQENHHVLCSHWISSPLPGPHMCASDRQSNMTAIYTHWVRWKVLGLSLRPRSPKRMGKKTDKAGKRPVNFYILGCLGCFPMAGTLTCTQTHSSYTDVCERVQQKHRHTHTVTNTAARAFDVQGGVSVVHVCPLKSFPALGVKHGNKGKQHIQKCQTTHLAFHVSWIMVTWKQLHSVKMQDRLIDTGCCRRREVTEAASIHLCHELSSSKNN